MNSFTKALPWVLVAVVAVVLAVVWANHTFESANAKVENAVLKKQLEQARLPEVEVQVSMRKGLMTSGNVAGLKNMSGGIIAIVAEVERPNTPGLRKSFAITLDPGQTKELGGLEGWSFAPGDTIRLTQSGHKPVLVTTR